MKKNLSVLLISTIVGLAITGTATAQNSDEGVAFASFKNNPDLLSYANAGTTVGKSTVALTEESLKAAEKDVTVSKESLRAMKANFRASEKFKKLFKDGPEATWSVEKKAIVAYFEKDEIQNRIVYNKQGRLIYSLSYYQSDKIPKNISKILKSVYPDLTATIAIYIKEGGLEFYVVNIEDEKKFKQVSVYNGEINLMSEFNKTR